MKKIHLLTTFLFLFPCFLMEAAQQWHHNYCEAHQLAKQEKRPLLLFFNGSDWSGLGMKMKHEILATLDFQNKISPSCICVEIDFPEHTPLSELQLNRNLDLKKQFNIESIPTLVLIDSEERVIAKMGYLPESGAQLAEDLLKIIRQDEQLVVSLKNLSAYTSQLRELYSAAQDLRREEAIEQIVEAGIQHRDPFFYTEKYRLLVEKGEMESEQATLLRKELVALNVENKQSTCFTLALIDFQGLSQKNLAPEAAIKPLLDYLAQFESTDTENVWRLEMMIAQLYMDADDRESALYHAEKALKASPETMKSNIAHSLEYIRSSTSAH